MRSPMASQQPNAYDPSNWLHSQKRYDHRGHCSARLVERASHVQRRWPHCVSLPLSLIPFPVISQSVLSIKLYKANKKKTKKKPQNKQVTGRALVSLLRDLYSNQVKLFSMCSYPLTIHAVSLLLALSLTSRCYWGDEGSHLRPVPEC